MTRSILNEKYSLYLQVVIQWRICMRRAFEGQSSAHTSSPTCNHITLVHLQTSHSTTTMKIIDEYSPGGHQNVSSRMAITINKN